MVLRLRMRRARMLLLNTDDPVKWISGRVGYESPLAFSAAFKHHFGVSPTGLKTKSKSSA